MVLIEGTGDTARRAHLLEMTVHAQCGAILVGGKNLIHHQPPYLLARLMSLVLLGTSTIP